MTAIHFVLLIVYGLWVFGTARSCSNSGARQVAAGIGLIVLTGLLFNLWQVIALFVIIVGFFTKLIDVSRCRVWVMGTFVSCCCMLAGVCYGLHEFNNARETPVLIDSAML